MTAILGLRTTRVKLKFFSYHKNRHFILLYIEYTLITDTEVSACLHRHLLWSNMYRSYEAWRRVTTINWGASLRRASPLDSPNPAVTK